MHDERVISARIIMFRKTVSFNFIALVQLNVRFSNLPKVGKHIQMQGDFSLLRYRQHICRFFQ